MSLYTSLQSKAQSLLTKFGRTVTLRKLTAGTYNASTGSVSITPSDSTLQAAIFDMDGQTERSDSLAQVNDKKALLQAGGAVPTVDDQLVIGGVVYNILSIKETNPAGTPVLYELHLRRG